MSFWMFPFQIVPWEVFTLQNMQPQLTPDKQLNFGITKINVNFH